MRLGSDIIGATGRRCREVVLGVGDALDDRWSG